ncbi:adenine phosphoribosyltransferase [Kosakonia cowanii]|nr:adenine phosphoribosyltransferase [Kosakonia cowanii]
MQSNKKPNALRWQLQFSLTASKFERFRARGRLVKA